MVTHDRYLIGALADRVWAIQDGELRAFRTYERYRDWRAQPRQERSRQKSRTEERQGSTQTAARERRRAARREAERQAFRRAELEERIHQLEARQAELEAELAAASQEQAVARVRELGAEHSRNEQRLGQLLAEWAEMA
jgi:ATPase subunit of ABC transporter with duplicated ATPase domains